MPSDLIELSVHFTTLTPLQAVGIPIALIGAVFLSFGAQLQHGGVAKVDARSAKRSSGGLSVSQLFALLRRPSWVLGTVLLGLAVVFQLTSLGFAPLIVVQPLGAIALVITAILNARVSRTRIDRASIRAILFCIGGVGMFVTIATFTAVETPITDKQLLIILIILGVVVAAFGIAFAYLRKRFKAIFYIVAAGVLYGFVATLAKVVIRRFLQGNLDWLTISCAVVLLLAAALGGYFVQTAYASGPPDLVIAGLTVIDPLVAVSIGIIVLGEASLAPVYAIAAFVVSGAVAIFGVFQLAKHHPQSGR
ncbi:MAG: DMT family transporter [Microbacteriaceae bacterium]